MARELDPVALNAGELDDLDLAGAERPERVGAADRLGPVRRLEVESLDKRGQVSSAGVDDELAVGQRYEPDLVARKVRRLDCRDRVPLARPVVPVDAGGVPRRARPVGVGSVEVEPALPRELDMQGVATAEHSDAPHTPWCSVRRRRSSRRFSR